MVSGMALLCRSFPYDYEVKCGKSQSFNAKVGQMRSSLTSLSDMNPHVDYWTAANARSRCLVEALFYFTPSFICHVNCFIYCLFLMGLGSLIAQSLS